MINQGASELSMMFGLDLEDSEKAVQVIYDQVYVHE